MVGEVKRLRVTCVVRNAAKANFLTTVSGNLTVRAPKQLTRPRLSCFSQNPAAADDAPSTDARHAPPAHAQVKQARTEIQKIFEKMASSQVTLISCAAP
jgi:hypothetical protein